MSSFGDASSSSELDVWDLPNNEDSASNNTIVLSTVTDENDSPSTEVYLESTGISDDNSNENDSLSHFSSHEPQPELIASTKVPSASIETEKGKEMDEDLKQRKFLADIVMSKCCMKQCLLHLTGHTILTAKRKICSLHGVERRQWITDKIAENSSYVNGKLETKFSVGGLDVCKAAFCLIYGFPPKTISRTIKSVAKGHCIVEHGNKGRKKITTKHEEAKTWMEGYFNLIGDKMPTSKQIHLPCWDTQKDIYMRYKDDMTEQMLDKNDILSLSMFYKLWQDDFSHVVIPENNRFAKCDICVKLKMESKELFNKAKKELLVQSREAHLKLVETERKKYYSHREKSRKDPLKSMAIIIDGMDQSKTNVPNTTVTSKSLSSLWRLRTHITGTLIHTKAAHGKLAYAFIDCLQWPHGSSLTLTILLKSICEFQKDHPLPEILYIQMDNTCRENKNRYVLCLCAVLVQLKIFQKVQINFLPVGHTHEDIDQLFSKISEEIKRSGCESIPDLIDLIHRSSTPNPCTFLLDGVWDFKEWLQPHLAVIEQHSWYHAYRFTRNSSGVAEMHYKQYSDHPWLPNDKGIQLPGNQLLMSCPNPSNPPTLLCPSPEKLDLDRLLRDLPKYEPWIGKASYEHWKSFMDKGPTELSTINSNVVWVLPILQTAASDRPVNIATTCSSLSKETELLLQKETRTPKKIIVRHSKRSRDNGASGSSSTTSEINPEPPTNQPIQVGNVVACYVDKYEDEEPQLAKIVNVKSESIEVHWMQGSYSDPWHPCKRKMGRQYEPWIEEIPRSTVLYQVVLTSNSRLTEPMKKKLKLSYSKL